MSTLTEELDQDAQDLTDELSTIQAHTVDDTTINATFKAPETNGDTLRLTATLPGDFEDVEREFDRPIPWSREFPIVRLAEARGLSAGSIMQLEGERVRLRRVDDYTGDPEWEFVIPEAECLQSKIGRCCDQVKSSTREYGMLVPLTGWAVVALLVLAEINVAVATMYILVMAVIVTAAVEEMDEDTQ